MLNESLFQLSPIQNKNCESIVLLDEKQAEEAINAFHFSSRICYSPKEMDISNSSRTRSGRTLKPILSNKELFQNEQSDQEEDMDISVEEENEVSYGVDDDSNSDSESETEIR